MNEFFQQSEKEAYFKRSANISESSGSKLFRTTTQISDAIQASHHKGIFSGLPLRSNWDQTY